MIIIQQLKTETGFKKSIQGKRLCHKKKLIKAN